MVCPNREAAKDMIASRLQTLLRGPVDAGPTMGSVGVDPLPPEFAINRSEASTVNRRVRT